MKELQILLCAVALTGCADSPALSHGTHFTPQQAIEILARFEHLRPPVSSATARRHFGPPSWTARADIVRLVAIRGNLPLRIDLLPGSTFYVPFIEDRGASLGYHLWLYTTPDISSECDLRAFFAGSAPASARITEFAICYPDGTWRNFPDDARRIPKR